jgi:hypothetical protein
MQNVQMQQCPNTGDMFPVLDLLDKCTSKERPHYQGVYTGGGKTTIGCTCKDADTRQQEAYSWMFYLAIALAIAL